MLGCPHLFSVKFLCLDGHDGFVAQKSRSFESATHQLEEKLGLQYVQNFECLDEEEMHDL